MTVSEGHGFDVDAALQIVRDRRETGDMRRGWGLELIGEFMDDVRIHSGPGGTTLTLIKRRGGDHRHPMTSIRMVVSKSAPLPRPWREKVVTAWCSVSLTIAKTLQIIGLLQTATLHETEEEAVNTVAG
ncbi:MAG: hypothetical protein HOM68_20885 [Gemmatimonadetes bacterium]|nr:hypothetical protein [Gemmatimonadota bacterium]MBT4609632.1 hypothetical protein [Gemmatimonadota bacterium]MBT5059012.1 hypothetical protein [Gemmatimonadota bacterium]MBT5145317.1 hypothetical protein [Gemmatimonadota bacterium]MBT5587511.1 hypothetical protein [Gemmatimonadota bacterium]